MVYEVDAEIHRNSLMTGNENKDHVVMLTKYNEPEVENESRDEAVPTRLAAQEGTDAELAVYPARIRLALGFGSLIVLVILIALHVWHEPPPFQVGFLRVVEIGLLVILMLFAMIYLIGLLSPFPLFSVSGHGIRTYSAFGLFGTRLFPWRHISSIVTYHEGRSQTLKIYSDNQTTLGLWPFVYWLVKREPELLRVDVSSSLIAVSVDELLEQIRSHYGREIAENGVRLIDRGEVGPVW